MRRIYEIVLQRINENKRRQGFFIDFSKAYNGILQKFSSKGICGDLSKTIRSLYKEVRLMCMRSINSFTNNMILP